VSLIEMLLGKGYQLAIYDRDVSQANLIGANREYIEREIPHIWTLMCSRIDEVTERADTVVIGNGSKEFRSLNGELDGRMVIDLARALGGRVSSPQYQGICW